MYETPTYIKRLVTPNGKKAPASRKVWSIDLEKVWLPFFHATNVTGDTSIPSEALGAPLRLAVKADGSIRFSETTGKPIVRVVKDISDMVRHVREEFTAQLVAHTQGVAENNPDAYNESVSKAVEAGKPLIASDNAKLLSYLKAESEAKVEAETDKVPAGVTA